MTTNLGQNSNQYGSQDSVIRGHTPYYSFVSCPGQGDKNDMMQNMCKIFHLYPPPLEKFSYCPGQRGKKLQTAKMCENSTSPPLEFFYYFSALLRPGQGVKMTDLTLRVERDRMTAIL